MTLIKRKDNFFPSVFDDFFGEDWLGTAARVTTPKTLPAVNIKETEENFEVELFSPGLDKKDFKIAVEDNYLTIGYEKKETNEIKEENNYRRREFRSNSFSRSFSLPKSVESDKIKARYRDGILKLEIPKREQEKTKPSRLIEIS